MPAHVKSALVGASVTIPIRDGKLATGTADQCSPFDSAAKQQQD